MYRCSKTCERKELAGQNSQRQRELVNVFERHVSPAALNVAYVCPMQPRTETQFFLREANSLTFIPEGHSE